VDAERYGIGGLPVPARTHMFSLLVVDEPLLSTMLSWSPHQSPPDMNEVDGGVTDEHLLTLALSSP
jgi:hypothetical protein